MVNVLVVDDHPAVGEGTRTIIELEPGWTATVSADPEEALRVIKERSYDVYLVDLFMPNINGIELTKLILQESPEATILIYTGFDLVTHFNMMVEAGVKGFVSKTATQEQLITAIRCALRDEAVLPIQLVKQLRRMDALPSTDKGQLDMGNVLLTTKEQQIVAGISQGLTNKAIAAQLSMSQRTVEYHLTKIFTKLKVGSRTEALVKSKEYGLLSEQEMR
ncbi:two component transcriptional regulator, luxr family [Bacillus sp. OxB-1]|uniref:response regulator transcription factor n=1 Tax=Bacillus sp. (strain OxB-1) TaxID=98228 RepID=UPI000581D160|nr:response regulator transcription factor [Bacillus sp. OxB-1]BAQ09883.1 two component transcriptional regulator, luxr family [Bacillus sp. OxB-1]